MCCSPWGHKELGMTEQLNDKKNKSLSSRSHPFWVCHRLLLGAKEGILKKWLKKEIWWALTYSSMSFENENCSSVITSDCMSRRSGWLWEESKAPEQQSRNRASPEDPGKRKRGCEMRTVHPHPPQLPPLELCRAGPLQSSSPSRETRLCPPAQCPRDPVIPEEEPMAGESEAASATAAGVRCARHTQGGIYTKGQWRGRRTLKVPPMAKSLLSFSPENTFKFLPSEPG